MSYNVSGEKNFNDIPRVKIQKNKRLVVFPKELMKEEEYVVQIDEVTGILLNLVDCFECARLMFCLMFLVVQCYTKSWPS